MREIIENGMLKNITKPARYIGGEVNQIIKQKYRYSITLCYPNIYEKAMSNYVVKMLYHNINKIDDVYCTRCFTPEKDFENLLLQNSYELYSLEDFKNIRNKNMLVFVIDNETDYTNFINMLKLSNIPLNKSDRNKEFPEIIVTVNENTNTKLIENFVDEIIKCDKENKQIKEVIHYITKKLGIHKNIDIDYPISDVIPSIKIENSSIIVDVLEVNDIDSMIDMVKKCIENQGITKVSFINYDKITEIKFCDIVYRLKANIENIRISIKNIDFSIFNTDIITVLLSCFEKASVTFNVGTCSTRINKEIDCLGIDRSSLIEKIKTVFKNNWSSIKLNFNIGLPYETYEDIDDIFSVAEEIVTIYSQSKAKDKLSLIVNITNYIPIVKENTECTINNINKLETKIRYIKEKQYDAAIKVNLDIPDTYITKVLLKNGNKDIDEVLIKAYELGARFDGSNSKYNKNAWDKAIYSNTDIVNKYIKYNQ